MTPAESVQDIVYNAIAKALEDKPTGMYQQQSDYIAAAVVKRLTYVFDLNVWVEA